MSASIHGSIARSRGKVIVMSLLTEASTSPAVITFVEEASTFAIEHVGRSDSGNQSSALYFTARSRKYIKVRPERPFLHARCAGVPGPAMMIEARPRAT